MTTVLNAEGRVLGRLATEIAQKARKEEVKIVNAEKAVISGDEDEVKDEYRQKYERGSKYRGPFFPKSPERILKRTVRGMLPDTKEEDFLGNVKAYIGVPHDLEDFEEPEAKSGDDLKHRNYVKLGEVSRYIGWTPKGDLN